MSYTLIFGSNGNIGSAIASYELSLGKSVVGIDIAPTAIHSHQNFTYIPCDISSPSQCRSLSEKLYSVSHNFSSVVYSAALDSPPFNGVDIHSYNKGIQNASFDDIQQRIKVNVTAQIFAVKVVYDFLDIDSHQLFFSSIYGKRSPDHNIYSDGFIKPLEYSVSKASIDGLVKHLALTCSSDRKGRVNGLVLGGLEGNQDFSFKQKYISKVPLGRMASTDDIINAYSFLCSTSSSYITGSMVTVDGGYLIR